MKITRKVGTLCLAAWLIISGLGIVGLHAPEIVTNLLALAAGVLLLVDR